ncbi:L-rhamnose mutarotase [Pontiellaceae bacterium B12227]|nr:L-rhamnose mutarotase [Pontiellaceae bacterium B12227]
MKRILFLLALSTLSVFGFSPYENYLMSGKPTRVGLIASVKAGSDTELDAALQALAEKKTTKALKKQKITGLATYKQTFAGKTWIMVYFDYTGKEYLQAAATFEKAVAFQTLEKWIEPHPRAARYGTQWLQMEWINYIRASQEKGAPTDRFAMVTRIKPKKEQEYRLLHQTVWPGVVDQMVRSNYRNFSVFFVEIEDELYEFFHVDYVGDDIEKDNGMTKQDPFTQRWWKITDACQNPLPGASGPWLMMDKISK